MDNDDIYKTPTILRKEDFSDNFFLNNDNTNPFLLSDVGDTTIQKPKVTKFNTYKDNKQDVENNNNNDIISNINIIDMETTPTRTQDYIIDDNFTYNLHNEYENLVKVNGMVATINNNMDQARRNLQEFSRVINNTDKLLDLWINILSQSIHNQQLLSNKLWQGLAMEQLKPIEDTKSKDPENLKSNLENQEEMQELTKPSERLKKTAVKNSAIPIRLRVPQSWKNVEVTRMIDLYDPIIRESTNYIVENIDDNETIKEYYYPIPENWNEHLSYIEAKEKKTNKLLKVEKIVEFEYSIYNMKQTFVMKYSNVTGEITLETAYTHLLIPYPCKIDQNDKQYLLYQGNLYGSSAYSTEKLKINIRLPTSNVLNYTKNHNLTVTHIGNLLSYEVYNKNIESNKYDKLEVHYEYQKPIITIKNLRRDLDLSHWGGNLAIEEHFNITNDGARLKGQFSRVKYQKRFFNSHEMMVLNNLKIDLPINTKDIYYRDEIGNVSTSHLEYHYQKDKGNSVFLKIKPRFPLFGGWNYTWNHGYNVPLGDFVRYHSESDQYILNIPFMNLLPNATYDQVQIRIILPEGAKDVKVELPFPIDEEIHSIHKTYLDTIGRYLITLKKNNLVSEHSKFFQVSYKYNNLELLRKPLMLFIVFLGGFLLNMIYSRMASV
ncbi:6209_t:CDS:2 [Entrophospora sp. SA101]|nr:14459_t:CDS:2 [Entrophospora sp. SA101]CAJ0746780.1 6209_t:CDS:2 [Entrophospora sp. SA101]CAJ0861450.1 11592_t:CDS:2 [Entrophospora sp. SA101]